MRLGGRPATTARALRLVGATVAALALTATTAVVMPAASAQAPESGREGRPLERVPVPELDWRPCDGEPSDLECATARVPLDYDRPQGKTIELALIRLPATGSREGVRALFHNPGGPGATAVGSVRAGFGRGFAPAVRARYDVVGVDPRGVAGSEGVDCFAGDTQAREDVIADSVPFPVGATEERWAVVRSIELARRCQTAAPGVIPHMSTANVARDLEMLRRAVGDDELNFYGQSYGSFLGQTYAALFPDRVGAFVLDGNVDPRRWITGPGVPWLRNDTHTGTEAAVEAFFAACDEAGPRRCPLTMTTASARERTTRLFDRLAQGSVVIEDQGERGVLRYAEALNDFVSLVASQTGNWQLAAQVLDQFDRLVEQSSNPPPGPQDEVIRLVPPSFLDAQLAITCSENDHARSPRQWPALARRAANEAPFAGARTAYFVDNQACASWQLRDRDRYTGPWRTRTANPVLLLNNTLDTATPVENAEVVNRLLPGSVLLRVDAVGHLINDGGPVTSRCAADAVDRYLLKGSLPRPGTICPSEQPEPFPAQPAGPVDGSAMMDAVVDSAAAPVQP